MKLSFIICLCGSLLACDAPKSRGNPSTPDNAQSDLLGSEQPVAANTAAGSASVTDADFKKKGLKWPLTVEAALLGCTSVGARWAEVGGVKYGLNGRAKGNGFPDIDPFWREDQVMADFTRSRGIPNDPPVRVSISDMIDEAGKYC